MNLSTSLSVIEPAGQPALRIAFTIAVLLIITAGVLIFRRRKQLFGQGPDVENDVPVVRHNRMEETIFVWSGLTLVLLSILYQLWFD